MICSYVLMPVAFLMGADWADSPVVAELLGIKIFLNEFVAYQQLATYKKNRLDGLEEWNGGQKQWISVRATANPTGHRALIEPAQTGHGAWQGRGVMVWGTGGHPQPTRLECPLTTGFGVILKDPLKSCPTGSALQQGRS